VQRNSFAKLLLLVRSQHPIHLDEVGLGHVAGSGRQLVGQLAVVGQEQQPFTMVVQPANREDALLDPLTRSITVARPCGS